jgi:serine/threonine protein kinase
VAPARRGGYKAGNMEPSAVSLGQLAVRSSVITRTEYVDLSRRLREHAEAGDPVSFGRLLLQSGISGEALGLILSQGARASAVRCDGCGRAMPQAELAERGEVPCPGCGTLLLGFRAYVAGPQPTPAPADELLDEEAAGRTLDFRGVLAPSGGHARAPLDGDTTAFGEDTTVNFQGVIDAGGESPSQSDLEEQTFRFRGVLPIPADAIKGAPLGPDESAALLEQVRAPTLILPASQLPRSAHRPAPPPPSRTEQPAVPAPGARGAGSGGDTVAPGRIVPPADPAPRPAGDDPYGVGPGDTLDGFKVIRQLGEGAMGRVYLARQEALDRLVAIKLLHPTHAADKEFLERFQREAKSAASFKHPNVVMVHHAGRDANSSLFYIAFEYVEGGTLDDLLGEQGRLSEEEALGIARGVARALEFTESQGLVHRDVKPGNILLTLAGEPKLADLGLARETDRIDRITQPGIILGTPAYMAPEQALNEEEIDVRLDLYALGIVLWEMLTGFLPLDDASISTAALIGRHVKEDVPDVRLYRPVSDGTAQIVRGLSARKREERYPSPAAAVHDIERVQRGELPLGPHGQPSSSPQPGSSSAPAGLPKLARELVDSRAVTAELDPGDRPTAPLPEPPPSARARTEGPSRMPLVVLVLMTLAVVATAVVLHFTLRG